MTLPLVRRGEHHPIVPALKRRLGFSETSDLYDLATEQRVRGVQMVNGHAETHGQLTLAVLEQLGVRKE